MENIKEVIFFSYGDSNKASTWSNVPYLFTKTLEEKGIVIRRIQLLQKNIFINIFNRLIIHLYNIFYHNHVYDYIRTPLFRKIAFKLIKRTVEKYGHADCCIFTGFSLWNKFNNIPTILFGDWTYEILIKERLGRLPYKIEGKTIKWEDEAINASNCVISLFPECARSIKKKNPNANIYYLGSNVVNCLYTGHLDSNYVIRRKKESQRILFIGDEKYKNGCLLLIKAFNKLVLQYNELKLDIIGMQSSDFKNVQLNSNIYFHGYLKKDEPRQCDLYYQLMLDATIFVNPTKLWAGYSSTIEAMYFYTPIIVSKYKDFITEFGENISFGIYNKEFDSECLYENIIQILTSSNYEELCKKAHDATKSYTWENYVDKILNLL